MKKPIKLEQLLQPLNVDKTLEEIAEEHEEMQVTKEEVDSELDDTKEELKGLQENVNELNTDIESFESWLRELPLEIYDTKEELKDEILEEFIKLIKPIRIW